MLPTRHSLPRLLGAALLALLAACGEGPTEGQPKAELTIVGGGQTARTGTAVDIAPGVVVRDADGNPVAGATVTFEVTAGGGGVERGSAVTDAAGAASAGRWILGDAPGTNVLSVRAGEGSGARTTIITALARPPRWTILVWLAGDAPLSLAALAELDDLESIATGPEVQVVVQGELSAAQLELAGITAEQVNVPAGFQSFRYRVQPVADARPGPDVAVTALGDRDFTDPAQLREFVTWGRTTYPGERTALVLWSRASGTDGVATDAGSAGGRTLTLAGLRTALQGTGTLDLLDVDVPFAGSYETLDAVRDLARVVTLSQGEVSPQGNPWSLVFATLAQQPGVDARLLGALIVDRYDGAHLLSRSSATKSAYDMAGYPAFAQALGALATALRDRLGTVGGELASAVASAQRFGVPGSTDLVNALDSLRVRTGDATLRAAIAAVRAQAVAPAFRVSARARTGSAEDARAVERATGLSVVLPSGTGDDRLPSGGPGSVAAYQQLHAGRPWTPFLTAWGAAAPPTPAVDQGERTRLELYLTWNVTELAEPVDLDLAVIEPNGDLYIPFIGSVTPNGQLTPDVSGVLAGYEGYLTDRWVEPGTYHFFAMLWSDPSRVRPAVEVQYRTDQRVPLAAMFAPELPRLSLDKSWQDDETFTWAEVFNGAYGDLVHLASFDVGPGAVLPAARADGDAPPALTAAQLRVLQEAAQRRRAGRTGR